ncbi:hypothetical protein HK098_001684 [Nowakowskiella sp. JEL0407]|nr:hypothetical protein HK098_001684 [Nowakowskiella sp. JEL0407]
MTPEEQALIVEIISSIEATQKQLSEIQERCEKEIKDSSKRIEQLNGKTNSKPKPAMEVGEIRKVPSSKL